MPDTTDWQMRRIESPDENPCCALVREFAPYKATVYYTPESQAWTVDVMQGEKLVSRREHQSLFCVLGFVHMLDRLR